MAGRVSLGHGSLVPNVNPEKSLCFMDVHPTQIDGFRHFRPIPPVAAPGVGSLGGASGCSAGTDQDLGERWKFAKGVELSGPSTPLHMRYNL